MNLSEQERTWIVRTWLDEGSSELSPRVRDAVLREFPGHNQEGAFRPWPMSLTAYATVAVAAAALVVVFLLAAPRLLPDMLPGGDAPIDAPPTASPTPTPEPIDRSYRDVGYIGLPPPDATSSEPSPTELVETFFHPGGPPYRGAIFLYADGRMIWNEYHGAGFSRSTGWLEQRLTGQGIELVRELAKDAADVPGRLDPARLPNRLPTSAWAVQTVRPYVPNAFAACVFAANPQSFTGLPSFTPAEQLAMLPEPASELLRNRRPMNPTVYDDQQGHGPDTACYELTLADARRLDAALRDAGLEQDAARNSYLLEYHLEVDGQGPETWWLNVWFEPILPDGTITCSSCG